MLINDESHTLVDRNQAQGQPLLNEVLGAQLTEARIELEAAGLQAELHVA